MRLSFISIQKETFAIIKISQCMFSDEKWKKSSNALTKVGYFERNSLKERQKSIKSDA